MVQRDQMYPAALILAGVSLFCFGAYLIYPPLTWLLVGALFVACGVAGLED
jgi:hypothetical protein